MARTPKWYATTMLQTLRDDLANGLERIDDYVHGIQDMPFEPATADEEYKKLGARAITNVVDMPVKAVCQNMAVDGFRPGLSKESGGEKDDTRLAHTTSPQWDFFQRNHLDSRQDAVHRAACRYGHAFVANEKGRPGQKSRARGLSPLTTTALFDDPANDIAPVAALHVLYWEDGDEPGEAIMWLGKYKYRVIFDAGDVIRVGRKELHGFDEPPVTRFAVEVDLDGRTTGLVEPAMNIQDRLNQAIFDQLVTSTYSAFQVRTITGMAPPVEMEPVYGEDEDGKQVVVGSKPKIDKRTGEPVPKPIAMMAKSVMWAEDPEVKFDTLDPSPLDGHIAQVRAIFQEFTALTQVPPHYMLGEIANLSAEALDAAQQSLERLTNSIKTQFGESWERVVRLAMEIEGEAGHDDLHAEVIWADKDGRAFAAFADGAGKLRTELGIPGRGLWHRVPGSTQGELALWERLADEEPDVMLAEATMRATGGASSRTNYQPASSAE